MGLWVNGQKLIDPTTWERDGGRNLSNTSPYTSTGIALTAGQKYTIELKYYEWQGDARISLQWQSASQALEVIPQSQLYTASDVAATGATSSATASRASRKHYAGSFSSTLIQTQSRIADEVLELMAADTQG